MRGDIDEGCMQNGVYASLQGACLCQVDSLD